MSQIPGTGTTGQPVPGSDGTDWQHRQTVASHYQQSVQNKARLKFVILMHIMLFFIMLLKLSEDILDRMDIFILELQELYIPKPRLWEWIWAASVLSAWTGLKSLKKNNVTLMNVYAFLVGSFCFLPVLYELFYWFPDFRDFAMREETDQQEPTGETPERVVEKWRGFPLGLLWYPFLVVAMQIHIFQLYFASNLIKVWSSRTTRSKTE